MLQSIQNRSKTEIDNINGVIFKMGEKYALDVPLNKVIIYVVSNLC
jgi:ketopantoate reductase